MKEWWIDVDYNKTNWGLTYSTQQIGLERSQLIATGMQQFVALSAF